MTEQSASRWPTPDDLRSLIAHPQVKAELLRELLVARAAGELPADRALRLSDRLEPSPARVR